jgi:hypothetical protein
LNQIVFHSDDATQYQAAAASMYGSQPLVDKRRRSLEDAQDTSIKRQKIEPQSEQADFDLEALLAQATAGATLSSASRNDHQAQRPASPAPQQSQIVQTPLQTTPYDPNLYMWVMSLPILENLVRVDVLCQSRLEMLWQSEIQTLTSPSPSSFSLLWRKHHTPKRLIPLDPRIQNMAKHMRR